MNDTAPRSDVPPLTRPEIGLTGMAALAAAGVGALGLASSFTAVSAAAARWEFAAPWMLPIGIDIAIPVFTVANLLLIRMDMRLAWVRFVPWVLTLVTCGLNIAAGTSTPARVAHGTMPLLWVVFSEIVAHIYAVRIGAATGRRMEKIRRSRWLLAPLSTFVLWRRMTLWEVTSYTHALALERERQLARADLRETYGRSWRKRTPRRQRVLLKLGDHTPATTAEPTPEQPTTPAPEPAAAAARPEPPAAAPQSSAARSSSPRPAARRPRAKARKTARTPEELLSEAREATATWTEGELTAERIRTAVRTSQANARALRESLRAERTTPALQATEDTEPALADANARDEDARQAEEVAA
ncbi:DUF2637 domain-containing protein [Streptomyces sp. NPDC047002]|uniref:DUF2637 domain-containing protein n=1 Tax=Streptomyces sp. NPDC047002 TaxID=3155475 RepID=UPI003452CD0A